MGKKSIGLGRGLGEILRDHSPENAAETATQTATAIPLKLIDPNPFQPRKTFAKESLQELAESIKTHGILEPILLRKNAGRYQIVSGERRVRAARIAGLTQIENARIFELLADKTMAEWAIIENIQRDDLNAIELSQSYQQLLETHNYTHEELAARLNKSRAAITNSLRLLKLPEKVQEYIKEGKLAAAAARSLLSPNIADPLKAAEEIIAGGLSVREAEGLANEKKQEKKSQLRSVKPKPLDLNLDPDFKLFIAELQEAFGTQVQAKPSRANPQKGTLLINYNSFGDLTRIREIIATANALTST